MKTLYFLGRVMQVVIRAVNLTSRNAGDILVCVNSINTPSILDAPSLTITDHSVLEVEAVRHDRFAFPPAVVNPLLSRLGALLETRKGL